MNEIAAVRLATGGACAGSARDAQRPASVEESLAYWRRRLAGIPAILELSTDRPRPPKPGERRERESVVLSQDLKDRLEALAGREGTTLEALLLAAFHSLLARYTRQDDIVVGATAADGADEDFAAGCLPAVPVRMEMRGELSFVDLLGRVSDALDEARAYFNVEWEGLVAAVEPEQDASRYPVFQAQFSLEDSASDSGWQLDEAPGEAAGDRDVELDLELRVRDLSGGLAARFDYRADLFDAATIARMAGHYQVLLDGIATNSETEIARLPLLSDAERHQLIVEWNDTAMEYPRGRGVHHLFEAQAARTPDAIAVVFGKQSLTYRELDRRANQLARHLITMGAKPDGLVGICVERSLEMVVGLMGILKSGSAYVPIDPAYPADRVAFMLEDSEAPLVVTESQLIPSLPSSKAKVVLIDADWKEITKQSAASPALKLDAENRAYVIYTSGSTGKPKGVEIPHRAVVNFLTTMAKRPGMNASDRLLAVTTLSFDIAGLEMYLPLTQGAMVEIVSREMAADGDRLKERLAASGTTVMQATPATWRMLLEAGWTGDKRLKILIGGEAVPEKLASELVAKCGSVWNVYGPTETTIWSTTSEIKAGAAVTIGRPIGNTEIFILDKLMQPVPIGVAGELHIGGDGLARGYLKREALTAEKFIAGHALNLETGAGSKMNAARLYKTGDLVRYRPNGDIEFLGRIDHQVKIRGFRIELGEIESVLRQHAGIKETVVVAREDAPGDKRVVAYFVASRQSASSPAELRTFLKTKLPEYMLPSVFVPLAAMPLTPNGKIDRRALPAPQHVEIAPGEGIVAPRDEVEAKLARMWEAILKVRPVGVRQDFFELGGHSLLAARMMTEISRGFGANLPIATLFQARTVEQLARILRDRGWKPAWSSLVPIQTAGTKLPFFCVHGIGGNVLGFYELATELGPTQPFYGLQAQGLDGRTPPHTRAEDMAAHYVKEIRELQPEGPYCLGGLSFGGAIAFEMARQLQAQGQEVGVLALFDTFVGERKSKTSLLIKLVTLPPRQSFAYAAHKVRTFFRNLERWFLPETLKKVRAAHRVAHLNYIMQRYDGRVTLFVPHDPSLRASEDPEGDWKQYAAQLEMIEVPGDHETLLDEPHVCVLAERLAACMERAEKQPRSAGQR